MVLPLALTRDYYIFELGGFSEQIGESEAAISKLDLEKLRLRPYESALIYPWGRKCIPILFRRPFILVPAEELGLYPERGSVFLSCYRLEYENGAFRLYPLPELLKRGSYLVVNTTLSDFRVGASLGETSR